MSEKNIEMMKKLLEQKTLQQGQNQKKIPEKKIGTGHKEMKNTKTGGSNNKI